MFDLNKLILDRGILKVSILNVSEMDKTAYALSRKDTLGASDSAVVLGVNPYANVLDLIKEKSSKEITSEEAAIGEKATVKKGFELEDFVREKAEKDFFNGTPIYKPAHSYIFKEYPFLSVNFDGILQDDCLMTRYKKTDLINDRLRMDIPHVVPVEIKVINMYAYKMWNPSITNQQRLEIEMHPRSTLVQKHLDIMAEKYGVPVYYYTQIQQQIAALNAPYGYIVVQYDVPYGPTATWSRDCILIQKDPFVIDSIIVEGYKVHAKITK